jgi:MFS family permease
VSSGAGAGEQERQQLLGQREAGVDSIGASGAGTKQQQQQQQQGDRNSSARQRGGARCTRVGLAVSGARRWWSAMHALFGGNFLGSIAVVYFLQGSRVGFTYLATDYYYRDPVDGLGLSPAEAQALIAVSGLPWSVKPLFGVLCDAVPLCGTHRKGYLGLMGTLGTVGYVLMAVLPPQRWLCTAALFLCSLGSAFCDVVVDAMVARGAKQEPATAAGNLQSLAWSAYAVGSILGSVIGGVLYSLVGARVILGMFGALYSLTILRALPLPAPFPPPTPSFSKFTTIKSSR